MKKFICVIIAAAMFLSLASCSLINLGDLGGGFDLSGLLSQFQDGLPEDLTNFDINDILNGLTGSGNAYTFDWLTFDLPEGFSVQEKNGTKMAIYEDYPTHSDNITFVSMEGSADDLTENALKDAYTSSFGSIENFKYERSEINGLTVIRTDFDMVYSNIPMHEIACTYFSGSKAVVMTFTSVTGEFDSAFEEVIASAKAAE